MCIEIFRYAGQAEFCRVNLPRPTRRAPGNVPYLIDNLWEWMRPERMPNRRHAVFASPTANLAMEGAGAPAGNETNVGIVEFVGVANVAQVSVSDARMHPDVRTLRNVVLGYLGNDWLSGPIADKERVGRIFIPLLASSEVRDVLGDYPELGQQLRAASTFWNDVRPLPTNAAALPYPNGEIFFEAPEGYRLRQAGAQ